LGGSILFSSKKSKIFSNGFAKNPMKWLLIFGLLCLANIGLLIESRDSVVSQEIRHEELAQTYRASLETGNLLTKYAGTGYDDTQSEPVGKFEAAGWTDDLGLYVVTSAVGIVGIDNLSINSILRIFAHVVYSTSLILCTFIIRKLYFCSSSAAMSYVVMFNVFALLVFHAPLGVTMGRNNSYLGSSLCTPLVDCGEVDLFYGIQSLVVFASCCALILIVVNNANRWKRASAITVASIIAVAMLFRSDLGIGLALLFAFSMFFFNHWKIRRIALYTVLIYALSVVLKFFVVTSLYFIRFLQSGIPVFEHPQGHPVWHALYIGLSFNLSGIKQMSSFGVYFQDNFLYQIVASQFPDIVWNSKQYSDIVRLMFFDLVRENPVGFLGQLLTKAGLIFVLVAPQVFLLALMTKFDCFSRQGFVAMRTKLTVVALMLVLSLSFAVGAILVWPSQMYIPGTIAFLELMLLILLFPSFQRIIRRINEKF
jgi:hypothetical protein